MLGNVVVGPEQGRDAHHRLLPREHDGGSASEIAGQRHADELDHELAVKVFVRVARASAVLGVGKFSAVGSAPRDGEGLAVAAARGRRSLGQPPLEVADLIEVPLHPLTVEAAEVGEQAVGSLLIDKVRRCLHRA
jgi:hypothetical protein